jgi:hypothetical protein
MIPGTMDARHRVRWRASCCQHGNRGGLFALALAAHLAQFGIQLFKDAPGADFIQKLSHFHGLVFGQVFVAGYGAEFRGDDVGTDLLRRFVLCFLMIQE